MLAIAADMFKDLKSIVDFEEENYENDLKLLAISSGLLNYMYANYFSNSNDDKELKKAYNLFFDNSIDYCNLVKLDPCVKNINSLINV